MPVVATQRKPLREVRTKFTTLLPFLEANGVGVDRDARTARVVIITEGLGNLRDRNYYTREAVDSCVKVFDGRQFFIDHPSQSEEEDRPERSIRDLAGYFFGTQPGRVSDPDTGEALTACFATLKFDESASGQMALDKVATALEYQKRFPNSKDVYAGISINGGGVSHPGTIKGMNVNMVTEIEEAFSADIVTKPARGGRFLALMKEAGIKSAWLFNPKAQRSGERRETMARTAVSKQPEGKKKQESDKDKGAKRPVQAKESTLKSLKLKTIVKESSRKRVRTLLGAFHEAVKQVGEDKKTTPRFMAVAKASLFDLREAGYDVSKMSGKLRNLKAALDAPPDDPGSIATDIKADIDELLAQLGMKPSEPQGAGAGGVEDEADEFGDPDEEMDDEMGGGAAADDLDSGHADPEDVMTDEEEDEAEAEGETEDEGGPDDVMTDEEEEEPEGGDLGMGDGGDEEMGDEPNAQDDSMQAMQYKCAKCGEVNQVMPPKGTKIMRASESDRVKQEAQVLRDTNLRLRQQIHAKESRFEKANGNTRTLLRENVRLKAENITFKRAQEAGRQLKEAEIPRDILSVGDLMALEPNQWPGEIRRAKRLIENEARMLHGGTGRGSGGDRGKRPNNDGDSSDEAISAFRESYNGRRSSDDDE